ncbi:dCTP deaminase [Streptomyces sp. WAC 04229]|uniref:dCTP deaminase n=1 Tax=Streptomyces sp. WAC 04229 TaxID=2203206 RepID=UPI000F74ABD9|nr:dCTP deaminase [Streptomyces sp. WAC 04229]RSN55601.1 dCTP deaminase [Streptomyces sp. WAC 04229]
MLLSDRDLHDAIARGQLGVTPFDEAMLQPASIDVRLDTQFRVFESHRASCIDPAVQQDALSRLVDVSDDEPFVLHPGEFVLGSTFERVRLPRHLAGKLEGKSSLGRLGLVVHSTAGFIDPGFEGHVTLELANLAQLPIKLWPGMKIGQICVFQMTSPAESPYGTKGLRSRYQGQRGPTASRSHLDFQRTRLPR